MRHASSFEKVHFYEMHIFKYSRRKGTVADKMKEQVADTVKSERSAVLLALEKAQSLEYRKRCISEKRLEVLIEELTEIDGRVILYRIYKELYKSGNSR